MDERRFILFYPTSKYAAPKTLNMSGKVATAAQGLAQLSI